MCNGFDKLAKKNSVSAAVRWNGVFSGVYNLIFTVSLKQSWGFIR
jgi:hypothetical protein